MLGFGTLDAPALPGGNTGTKRTTSSIGGGLADLRCARSNTLKGSLTKNWSKLLTPGQLRSEPFVMPGVSCKTIFNNEVWTSKPLLPLSVQKHKTFSTCVLADAADGAEFIGVTPFGPPARSTANNYPSVTPKAAIGRCSAVGGMNVPLFEYGTVREVRPEHKILAARRLGPGDGPHISRTRTAPPTVFAQFESRHDPRPGLPPVAGAPSPDSASKSWMRKDASRPL